MTDPTPDVPTLRRLLAEATPGPWFAVASGIEGAGTVFHDKHVLHNDAALIVAAVNSLPGILHRLEAAEALADEWASLDVASLGTLSRPTTEALVHKMATALRAALAEVTP